MKVQVEKNVSEIGIKVVLATIEGLDNTTVNEEWNKLREESLRTLYNRYKDFDVHKDDILEGYNKLHDKIGVKRRKNIPSAENLIKMLVKNKNLPIINQIVDIYNIISIDSRLCVAAHNMDKMDGGLTVKISQGNEKYVPLGQEEPVPMNAGEYCYCDDSGEVLCRLEIRQVNKTKIDENVKNVLYIIEGHENTENELLVSSMQRIIDTTVKYCGGKGKIIIPDCDEVIV